jgi:5-hydroxyisourate hydrolase-like protein (transthyretin family)
MKTHHLTKLITFSLLALTLSITGCSKKKTPIPLFPLALMGSETDSSTTPTGSDGKDTAKPSDSNGVPLPEASTPNIPAISTVTPTTDSNKDGSSDTEVANPTDGNGSSDTAVATHGPAKITGKITPADDGSVVCTNPPTNNEPAGCKPAIDLSQVTVKLMGVVDGQEVVIATTKLDANGNYTFDVPDLANGTYRVISDSGNGLDRAYKDFEFTYSPTDTDGVTSVSVAGITAPRSVQEVATHGPANITGKITPSINGSVVCTNPPENTLPAGCVAEQGTAVDLTKVEVKLVQNVDGKEVVVATTHPDANGNYAFNLSDLNNGAYRVLTNAGDGLNYVYQDFTFTHDPTAGGTNNVALNDMLAERLYYTNGAAVISGGVGTPGFSGDVNIAAGALSGVTVSLKDSEGNVIKTTTTDADGKYAFCFNAGASCPAGGAIVATNLENGNYTVSVNGSTKEAEGRTFSDVNLPVPFSFSGNDQSVVSTVTAPSAALSWDAATSSSLSVTYTINNAAVAGDSTTGYTVKIKDSAGGVIATGTRDGAGNITLTASNVPAGNYTVEVTAVGNAPYTSSFNFVPQSAGGVKDLGTSMVNVVPLASKVVGTIQGPGGSPAVVPGAVVNFKPASIQPPSSLLYLLSLPDDDTQTVNLRNAAKLWLSQANTAVAACATENFSASCVVAAQGSGPWNYASWSNKVYDVNGTQLSFNAMAGKWDYYISAPGYENSTVNVATGGQPMVLNGQEVTVPAITMTTSDKRSQIKGSVAVLDLVTNTNVTGLFAVMLGNVDSNDNPVAHITTTANGQFAYDGNSKVVSLANFNTDLNGDGIVNDTDKIMYAIGAYKAGTATSLSASLVACEGTTCSVDKTGGFYNFKQSSYQVVIVDPLGHILTTPKQADNGSVATNTYTDGNAILDLANIPVPHQARRSISGTVTDAISTAAVSGATVTLGTFGANNVFQANVRRDCSAGDPADTVQCTMPTTRSSGNDQVVPSVTTNASGQYTINNVNPGNYVLKISQNGIDTYVNVTVTSTGNAVVNAQVITSTGRGNLTGNIKKTTANGVLVNFTETYSLEIVHPNFGTRPTAGVQPASLVSGMTTSTNTPNYSVFSINAGSWKVRFVSAGYVTVEGLVNIQANATTTLDIVTMVPGYQPPATISGRALSAMTNLGVGGLTVRVREGINVTSGPYVGGSAVTAADGSYALANIPAGNYTLEVTGDCTTTYRTVVSAGPDTPPNQNIIVSPILGADEVRVVVVWGASPRDVDSHLEYGNSACRKADGKKCQVVWNDRCHLGSGTCKNGAGEGNPTWDAALDVDDTTSYGPETITLKGTFWNAPIVSRRGYSLYNWSNETTLGNSQAKVMVLKSTGVVRTYVVSSSQTNRWWQIFCLTANKSIVDVGQAGCDASSFWNAPSN